MRMAMLIMDMVYRVILVTQSDQVRARDKGRTAHLLVLGGEEKTRMKLWNKGAERDRTFEGRGNLVQHGLHASHESKAEDRGAGILHFVPF